MNSTILCLEGLTKRFNDFTAVNQLSLEIFQGEIFGFLGPNGAGKTTTIKMIAGLLRPSDGTLSICGHDISTASGQCRRLTGYIPDRPYLYEKLTGQEYIHFIASLYSKNPSAETWQAEVDEYLHYFDIYEWKNNLIESYSHGMRQKLIISSILMLNQPLIVVDEPMVGLDPKSARIVKELFRKKASERKTIFLSTHSMEIAEELCDRVSIISKGSVIATGTVDSLRKDAEHDNSSLEDLFLQLTGAFELQSVIAALRNSRNGRQ
ncbi:MAG: ABC transporter ATP-binding protein [Desulfocapsaceae bacterium]|jgi:ABC-2 type transport system ATP-binding protein|nr:ABC transporter ATP-binding protein [Desulfocapsaceae bacterium]